MIECKSIFIVLGGLCALYILYIFLSGFGDMVHNMKVKQIVKQIPANGYASPSAAMEPTTNHVQITQMELHWPGHGNGPDPNNAYFVPTLDVYVTTTNDKRTDEAFKFLEHHARYGIIKPQGTTRTHLGRNRWRIEIPLDEPPPPGEDYAEWKRYEARQWAELFGANPYKNRIPEYKTPKQACTGRYGT